MSDVRINRLEAATQRHNDYIDRITGGMEKLEGQGERTNALLQEALLRDERFNAKIDHLESRITAQITASSTETKHAHSRIEKVEGIISRLAWTVVTAVVLGVMALLIKFGAMNK